jgi:hypothetical protein
MIFRGRNQTFIYLEAARDRDSKKKKKQLFLREDSRNYWIVIVYNISFVNLRVKSSLTCLEVVQLSSAKEDIPW